MGAVDLLERGSGRRRAEVAVMTVVTTEQWQQWQWRGDKGNGGGGAVLSMDDNDDHKGNELLPQAGIDVDMGEGNGNLMTAWHWIGRSWHRPIQNPQW